jgi:predicted phosphodiesterase
VKLAILSDIHANLEALQATLRQISGQAVDRILHLGDLVGYNSNPAECIALLRQFGTSCIAGNHDRATCGQITTDGFSDAGARAVAWTRRQLSADDLHFLAGLPLQLSVEQHLVAVHGALHSDTNCELLRLDSDEKRWLSLQALVAHPSGARICAFGHTHRLGIFALQDGQLQTQMCEKVSLRDDAYYLFNPGTVGQPVITDRRATYLILDSTRGVVTIHRAEYDASIPLAKSRRAGLLPRFSSLPLPQAVKRIGRRLGMRPVMSAIKWMGR